jgi:hypothetical protein
LLPHRLQDVITCLKWHRYIRLHLASNLLTELCTVVECGSRNKTESALMVSLKSALLSKDRAQMVETFGAWQENFK